MQHDDSNSFKILNENYDESSKNLLLDQYKTYVEMHDRISARRNQMNSFYVSLLSGILGFFSIVANQNIQSRVPIGSFPYWGLIIGLLGLSLCILWNLGIRAYARLVERKVLVIREMEEYLPFYCYIREGQMRSLDMQKETFIKYLRITSIEQLSSLVFGAVYLALTIYSLTLLF